MEMESQFWYHSPQNTCGISHQNSFAVISLTPDVNGGLSQNIKQITEKKKKKKKKTNQKGVSNLFQPNSGAGIGN